MTQRERIPPGPDRPYNPSDELLGWMGDQFAQFGDVYKASIYGTPAYVIRDPAHAEHVLRVNWRNYVKGQAIKRIALLLGNGLMVSEGEFWQRQRRMIQPALHGDGVANLLKLIRTFNFCLLESWEQSAQKGTSVNVTLDISQMVLKVVLVSIFGANYGDVGPYFNILSEDATRSLEFAQAFRSLRRVVLEVVERRWKEKTDSTDILGMLLDARDPVSGHGMPEHQLVNEIMTLIVAGHETTASTLNWVWYLLSQHPSAEEKLSLELRNLDPDYGPSLGDLPKFPYTRHVIEETLRLYPPGWLMTRKALRNDHLGDYFVPLGTEIYIPTYFIQRHPDLWHEPDHFNPDRFEPGQSSDRHRTAILPFSAGPRNCVGELLARVEMQIHLMMIASRLKLRYFAAKPIELELGVNLRSKHNFVMTPEIAAS